MSGFQRHSWRRNVFTLCIGIASAAAIAVASETAADLVIGKVRAGIVGDVADLRGIACMESVERTRYAPRISNRNATCGELLAAAANTPRGAVEWHSRLRLDVTSGAIAEEFALTDHGRFEQNDVGGIVSAATAGNGEFSGFLRSLIAGGTAFQAGGLQRTTIGQLLVFGFKLQTSSGTSYRGSLFAIPASGDLRRLTMEAENAGEACRVQYTIDYTTTRIGERDITVPQSSAMDLISRNGTELRSETYYSGCRRPSAETAGAPSNTPKPLPPNVRLRVRFQPSIDSATAATGDPVTAVIRTTVKDKQSGIVVHAGDRLHGRIAVIEQYPSPKPRWNIAVALETIERGVGDNGIDQGVEQPVSLVPVDDGDRTPQDGSPRGGYFVFHGPNVVLDQKFETEWETR